MNDLMQSECLFPQELYLNESICFTGLKIGQGTSADASFSLGQGY